MFSFSTTVQKVSLKSLKTFFLLSFMLLALNVHAMNLSSAMQQLDSAKSNGLVGEQINGYLGVVNNRNQASQIVQLINQARQQRYQDLAKAHNISLQKVEKLAGEKALEKTPSGYYIKLNNRWQQKP